MCTVETPAQLRTLRERPMVIGLTGPIAAGKSTVENRLRDAGAEIIDADRVYRSLLVPGSELARRIEERFGSTVVAANGEVDRAALGEIVFRDTAALADLDRITHPLVIAEIRRKIDQSTAPVVVIEAVKLVQSGLASDVDTLWFVTADEAARLRRLMRRTGLDESQARARIAAASGFVPKGVRADVSIDNSGDMGATLRAVDDAWQAVFSDKTKMRNDFVVSAKEEHS